MLSRCIESAEFLHDLERWKGYIIFSIGERYGFCPLSQKNRDKHVDDVVVIVRRK
jgi:hypothetical protein